MPRPGISSLLGAPDQQDLGGALSLPENESDRSVRVTFADARRAVISVGQGVSDEAEVDEHREPAGAPEFSTFLPRALGIASAPMFRRSFAPAVLVAALCHTLSGSALAFPGFFAYQGAKPVNRSTHVVLMKKGDATAVTVMPDYDGDLKPFVVVLPVPDDVKVEEVKTLRRDFVDRVDQISAPRFHEFWEMDPCESGKADQEWERDLSVHGSGFLGMDLGSGGGGEGPKFKPAKELGLTVDPEFKTGEQTFAIASAGEAGDIEGYLKRKGFTAPDGANAAVQPYVKAGMSFLVATVDTRKVELVGSSRAVVSPIRYITHKFTSVASTLGLLNLGDKQELFVYVLAPEERYEAKNYANAFPPTNLEVDFKVKERMGEFYAALHDSLLAKQPQTILDEYAWSTRGCGQPCPNEPMMIHELLTLGGDTFELTVPNDEKNPKAPDMTEEQKKVFDEIKDKKEQKEIEKRLIETARRKALIARHRYMLSRLHHRYDKSGLPKDLELGPAGAIRGGVDLPVGQKAELPLDVKPADKESQYQVRFVSLHPSPAVPHCDKPERFRWGKAPLSYRGLRKIWTAQDMATKNRTSHKPADMVITPAPAFGFAGKPDLQGGIDPSKVTPAPSASAGAGDKKGFCAVATPAVRGGGLASLALSLFSIGVGRARRRATGRRAS